IQAFKHSSIQAFKHSSIQAFKQRYHTFITFTKTDLKIPYSLSFSLSLTLLFPLSNPHHLFKPFDSISPIFKPVGLTELNSKEK
ncbi:hypothetical protein Q6A70_07920, partial [Helicobacter pylori]|nr:hypothetical protein [Helicobacter pylori]